MCARTINMLRLSIYLIFLAAFATTAWAVEGVKGGHRPSYPGVGNQYGNHVQNTTSEDGLCYKRVPHILALNASGGLPYNTIPSPQEGAAHDSEGWITILDCCMGYQRNITSGKCDPQCREGCFGGRCTGPDVCTCQAGWRPERGVCVPVCNRPCQKDAYCFSPEVCVCKFGYEEIQGQCRPVCPSGCKNGDCIAPHVCGCRPGYVLNDRQECVAVCEGGCPHGECTAPGICTCYDGYVNPAGERESCVPYCPGGCNGGECISPGICNCRAGYTRDPQGRCSPSNPTISQCRYGCGNGTCIGPNRCACEPGFRSEPDTGRCVPNNINNNHNNNNPGQYQSVCDRPCLNGDCTGPNQCTCRYGYAMDPTDYTHTRCVPICLNGCVNGVCSAPNFCLCNPGYAKDRSVKGSQRCVRQNP